MTGTLFLLVRVEIKRVGVQCIPTRFFYALCCYQRLGKGIWTTWSICVAKGLRAAAAN